MAYTTIKKSTDYFNTKLWTGTGSSNALTGVGFQPDWTWIKNRTDANSHVLQDAVRGVGNTIISNNTDAQSAEGAGDLTAFGSDGFTVGTNGRVNGSGKSIVAWNWLGANGTASNTDGSITSTVSANTTSGFSIVSYTGTGANATVGHGLGSAPTMIIVKNLNSTNDWNIGHPALGWDKRLFFNTNPESSGASWNSTAPTSSVFSIGTAGATNTSSNTHVAYCFAEVKGFSKIGSYVGNGSTDGTFVYTGFKPAFVIMKRSTTGDTASWYTYDNKRDSFNTMTKNVFPNLNNAENDDANNNLDFLSNGFKIRTASGGRNGSGITYIYMAFAEEPLVGDNPATAR